MILTLASLTLPQYSFDYNISTVLNTSVHPILASMMAQAATSAPLIREGVRTKPIKNNAGNAEPALKEAFAKRIKDVAVTEPQQVGIKGYSPTSFKEVVQNPQMMGVHARGYDDNRNYVGDQIYYNKNASPEVLAHELGHAVSGNTKVGSVIRKLRDNPKLAMALAAASGIIPMGAAMLTPGDDDYDEAMLGSLALASPTLIDEALASKNALAMMDTANMRANLGQRGRLASGLLSYVAAPIATASLATAIGNQFDENVPAQ